MFAFWLYCHLWLPWCLTTFLYSSLTLSFITILVLPSGICVIWDGCNCLWPGNTDEMFWVHQYHQYHTCQFLCCECCESVIHSLNVILTWSMSASVGSVMSLCVPTMSWCSTSLAVLALAVTLSWSAARTKIIFKTAFVAFFAKCWTVLVQVCCVALAKHVLLSLLLRPLALCELLVLVPFLLQFESFDCIYCCHWLCDSSIWLVTVEVLHHHLMLFWHTGVGLGMSHPLIFSSISPTSLPQSIWLTWNRSLVLCTNFSSVMYWASFN